MVPNPVIEALDERKAFYRTHCYYKEGKKKVVMLKPVTTAQRAIERKLPQAWDEPGTAYPLVLNRGQGIALIDLDHVSKVIAEETKERIPTYWDISYSGDGLHGYALTDLPHLNGRKKLVYQIGEREKIEVFLGCQPAILTNKHEVIRPLANCDQELVMLVADLDKLYNNEQVESGGVLCTRFFPREYFQPWLMTHSQNHKYPGRTKRLLLQYIWEMQAYYEPDGWKPFFEQKVAKLFNMSPQQMCNNLRELDHDGWLFRRHTPDAYGEHRNGLSIRLNVPENFLEG